MSVFQPRNRIQITRDMVARAVARSELVGLTRNSAVYHVIAAASTEDAEQYFQMARLRDLFSIDTATGSDLDERAAEVLPGTITRRGTLIATGLAQFSRPNTVGTTPIPAGTTIAGSDNAGTIKFRTDVAGSITPGNTQSGLIAITAVEAGARSNLASGQVIKLIDRPPGVTGVTNPVKLSNGRDRESDAEFRNRIKTFVQALSRGTPNALESFALDVVTDSGQRALFAHVVEPVVPDGTAVLYIDDGSGFVESFDSQFVGSPETLLTAAGGETDVFTGSRPVRVDGTLIVYKNAAPLVLGVDYQFNYPLGQIELVVALTGGDLIEAEYRSYTGLIQAVQRVMDGDPLEALTYPGVRPAGLVLSVLAPLRVVQTVSATVVVEDTFDSATVIATVESEIQDYINGLDVGADVIRARIIERAMSVTGMFNFTLTLPAADQVILANQVARTTASDINLT